nr:uncharacterized protein LOC111771110 [Equus caballus]
MPALTLGRCSVEPRGLRARPAKREMRRPAPTGGVGSPLQEGRQPGGTWVVRRVRHGSGQASSPVRSGAEARRGAAQMSADQWSALTCPRQERSSWATRHRRSWALEGRRPGVARAGPQVKGVRLRQPPSSCLHGRGSARPRAETATVIDGVTAPRPSHPLLPRRPPAPIRHGNTDVRASRPIAGSGRRKGARGGGGSGGPRRSGKEEREGRAEARGPRPHSGHPFPTAPPGLIAGRALASRERARRVLPLNALSAPPGSQSQSEPRFPRARAPARPQPPRGPRHVTAPSQGGSSGGASFGGGGGGGSGSGSSCAASVEREACGCGEKGAPDRNGYVHLMLDVKKLVMGQRSRYFSGKCC